jgi:hypothetical protein
MAPPLTAGTVPSLVRRKALGEKYTQVAAATQIGNGCETSPGAVTACAIPSGTAE